MKAYKVVRVAKGKLFSLYKETLDHFSATFEYSTDKKTPEHEICFVCGTLRLAREIASEFISDDAEIWECTGQPVHKRVAMPKIHGQKFGLWVEEESKFMTEVQLVKRVE